MPGGGHMKKPMYTYGGKVYAAQGTMLDGDPIKRMQAAQMAEDRAGMMEGLTRIGEDDVIETPLPSGAVTMRPDMLLDALLLGKELPGMAKKTIQHGLKALKGKGSEPMADLIRIGGDPEKLKRMQQAFGGSSMSDAQREAISAAYRRRYPEFFE